MRKNATTAWLLGLAVLSFAAGTAKADFTCPTDSNVCAYTVDTKSTPPVDLSGSGHTADKREWIIAPGEKYLVNPTVSPQGFTGRNVHCELGGSEGVQQRSIPVGDATVTVTFAKKYHVVAHAETGSGPSNISHTAMMICNFSAQLATLPK